jgi:hypothetical protein
VGPWLGQLIKVAGSAAQRMRSLLQDVDVKFNGWSKQGLQGVSGENTGFLFRTRVKMIVCFVECWQGWRRVEETMEKQRLERASIDLIHRQDEFQEISGSHLLMAARMRPEYLTYMYAHALS